MKRLLFLLCLFAAPAYGQLSENVVANTAGACNAAATSCTLSVTVAAGSDRYMFVWAGENAGTMQDNGCTYAGIPLTRQGGLALGGVTMSVEFYTLDDPAVGTANLVCNWDSSIPSALFAYVVNGSSGYRSFATVDYGGVQQDPAGLSATTVVGDWYVGGFIVRSATCVSDGDADTEADDVEIGSSARVFCASSEQATTTTTVISMDLSATATVGAAEVVIAPGSGGGGGDLNTSFTEILRRRRSNQ